MPTFTNIDYEVVDEEYSSALDRAVVLSRNPNALNLYDARLTVTDVIELRDAGSAVSVAPNGLHAAVAHEQHVTLVDLLTLQMVGSIDIDYRAADVALADNGFAYVISHDTSVLVSLNFDLGREVGRDAAESELKQVGILRSGGTVYGAGWGHLSRFDVSPGAAEYVRRSPAQGDFELDAMWVDAASTRIFTTPGAVFRIADDPARDMLYMGSFEVAEARGFNFPPTYEDVAQVPEADVVLAIENFQEQSVTMHGGAHLERLQSSPLGPGTYCHFIFVTKALTAHTICGEESSYRAFTFRISQ